ncbi:MAG: hypothetical protein H6661_07195 [Ardenticatenaceae bacterium]|nr:hypothetical protein [Ardenticatenaceae bacterium]
MTIGGVEFDLKLTFIVIFCTVVPMLDYYGHRLTGNKAYDRFILYFILPMLVILVLFRQPASDYGFKLGNWRAGLLWTLGACLVMALILWFVARTPAMQAYYQARAPKGLPRLIWLNGVELFAWEFIWRGTMLYGPAWVIGLGQPSLSIQAVPRLRAPGQTRSETLTTIRRHWFWFCGSADWIPSFIRGSFTGSSPFTMLYCPGDTLKASS